MSKLSAKRQVTLPKELCDRLEIQPGDELMFLEHEHRITIIRKEVNSSKGVLQHLSQMSADNTADEQSREHKLSTKHVRLATKKQAA